MADQVIINALSDDIGLEIGQDPISENDLLGAIATRVGRLMDSDSGLLFSYLYRLDVLEVKLNELLHTPSSESIPLRLARLILERQKARLRTKKEVDPGEVPEGWEW